MRYNGTRLRDYLKDRRGAYTELAKAMLKYRKPRKNAGTDEYNLAPFFRVGHNITLELLTGFMKETGKSIDFFVDFEPGELPVQKTEGVSGSSNIINSSINNDLTMKVDHLHEIIRLKDEMIVDKERIIAMKDAEIQQWKKRHDEVITLSQMISKNQNQ
ncbi:hypothetical protein L6475_01855 [Prevotella sp. E9-3]|uniref:hypothetical protein n=1 Tax=Prevotella sp. E9-3 TaxID=2913621 RepID=UPI001EDADEBB|nr:hypothetical protein [Prevotella sp. E9-3]UKK48738.1 hypothetical protein L6475_01855 [Prevotella sp. E9-3]